MSLCSISNTESSFFASLSLTDTLATCVSTASAGTLKAFDKTTFAVFLPTPGSDSSDALSLGTSS